MSDFGLTISANGKDARGASGRDILLTTKYPIAKIDRTNPVSLQNIHITFNNNTPLGPTLVYRFKHGYTYIPSTWSMFQVLAASPYNNVYVIGNGALLAIPNNFTYATIYTQVDDTYVNYYVNRNSDTYNIGGGPVNVTVAGVSVRIRTYVFVEDVGM